MEFKWIDVNDRMPDEHLITNDDTDTISDKVLVTYKFIDDSSMTDTARTYNGEWQHDYDCCHLHLQLLHGHRCHYHTLKENNMINEWIPCAEEFPLIDEEVLVSDGKYIWIDSLQEDEISFIYWDNYNDDIYKTAWMPLPNVWKGIKKDG